MTEINDKRPVLILASTGFIIRNLLLGRYARAMSQHRPLIVSTLNHNDQQLKEALKDLPITWIPYQQREDIPHERFIDRYTSFQHWIYRIKQAAMNSQGVDNQTRLFENAQPLKHRILVKMMVFVGRVLKLLNLINPIEDAYLNKISKTKTCQQWKDILKKHQPAALVSTMLTHTTTYNYNQDLPAVIAATELNIPQGTLVQSWDNLTTKANVIPSYLQRYWSWSPFMSGQLHEFHPRIKQEKTFVIGSPQYDFHLTEELQSSREEYLKEIGLDPNRDYIVIGSTPKKFMPYEHEMVGALIRKINVKFPELQVLIRFHPKDDIARWQPLRDDSTVNNLFWQETAPKTHMDEGGFQMPKDFYRDQVNTLRHAAIVLNSSSSLTIDAAILDVPCICFAYDPIKDSVFPEGRALSYSRSDHYGPLVEIKGIHIAYSEEEMLQQIDEYLKNPEKHKEGRKKIVEYVTHEVDGQAGVRMAEDTEKMIQEAEGAK